MSNKRSYSENFHPFLRIAERALATSPRVQSLSISDSVAGSGALILDLKSVNTSTSDFNHDQDVPRARKRNIDIDCLAGIRDDLRNRWDESDYGSAFVAPNVPHIRENELIRDGPTPEIVLFANKIEDRPSSATPKR